MSHQITCAARIFRCDRDAEYAHIVTLTTMTSLVRCTLLALYTEVRCDALCLSNRRDVVVYIGSVAWW